MALNLFKRSHATVADKPALAALRAHLATLADITDRRATLGERISGINRDVQRAESISADITRLQEQIDGVVADAHYNHQAEPALTDERKRLADLENQLKQASDVARRGMTILPRLQNDSAKLQAERDGLKPATDRLLWEAAREEGASYRDEYLDAMAVMRGAAHKVFAAFTAADAISKSRNFGEFCGSGLYAEMFLPLPLHPAYINPSLTPEAAQQIRIADIGAVSEEAEALIERLLNLED